MSESTPEVAPPPAAEPSRFRSFVTKNVRVIVAGGVGLVVGAVIAAGAMVPTVVSSGQASSELSAENEQLSSQLSNMDGTLAQTRRERDKAKEEAAAAKEKEADLQKRESAVADREAAVSKTEQTIAANSFAGGLMVVGRDVGAGTYRTGQITGMCYYAWKSSTEADADIVDNNIVKEGTATVTLRDGQIFESKSCGTWTKVG